MIHYISAEHITIEQIGEIIQQGIRIELSEDAKHRIRRCRSYLDKKINGNNAPIYGVTTGFGSLCNVSIGKDQLSQLQVNLIKSHACGTGERVPNEIVKIMLLLKIQSLSYGYSGCKLDTVQRLVAPRAAGPHVPAVSGTRPGGVSRTRHIRCRAASQETLETHRAWLQRGTGTAQRHAEHECLRGVGLAPCAQAQRLGRQDSSHVARCVRRSGGAVHPCRPCRAHDA